MWIEKNGIYRKTFAFRNVRIGEKREFLAVSICFPQGFQQDVEKLLKPVSFLRYRLISLRISSISDAKTGSAATSFSMTVILECAVEWSLENILPIEFRDIPVT